MVVHQLLYLFLTGVLLHQVEYGSDKLFVELFVSDFDLLNDIEEVGSFVVIEHVSQEQEFPERVVADVDNTVMGGVPRHFFII